MPALVAGLLRFDAQFAGKMLETYEAASRPMVKTIYLRLLRANHADIEEHLLPSG